MKDLLAPMRRVRIEVFSDLAAAAAVTASNSSTNPGYLLGRPDFTKCS
jgi:hypothetical protein